jgi:hypothetical protein
MRESKSLALPLGYTPRIKGEMMGIEPTRAGATIRCVNHFATLAIMLLFNFSIKNQDEITS